MKKHEKGFSLVETILVIVVVSLVGVVGWFVWSQNKVDDKSQSELSASSKSNESSKETLKEYEIDNEGLTFSYDPKITTITTQEPSQVDDLGLYIERLEAKTGLVTLSVIAGISGIGGGNGCYVADDVDRGNCTVVDTLKSTFLSKPIVYRLIEANQTKNCGYSGVPDCDVAPLVTSFLLDTYDKTDAYVPCCGTIYTETRNTGKKAKYLGSLVVSVEPDEQIQNEELLTDKDFLNTVKIIESMHY